MITVTTVRIVDDAGFSVECGNIGTVLVAPELSGGSSGSVECGRAGSVREGACDIDWPGSGGMVEIMVSWTVVGTRNSP